MAKYSSSTQRVFSSCRKSNESDLKLLGSGSQRRRMGMNVWGLEITSSDNMIVSLKIACIALRSVVISIKLYHESSVSTQISG